MWPQPRATLFPYTTLFRSCSGPALIVRQMLPLPASRSRILLSPCRDHPSFSNAFFLPEFGASSCLGVGQCSHLRGEKLAPLGPMFFLWIPHACHVTVAILWIAALRCERLKI